METLSAYEKILGETFIPEQDAEDTVQEEEAEEEPAFTDWKPELKKVVLVVDENGTECIIDSENFVPTERPQKPETTTEAQQEPPENRPFGDSAMLLKATIKQNGHGDPVDVHVGLEIQSARLRKLFQLHARHYTELYLMANPIVVEFPFRCLFFLRHKFQELIAEAETPDDTREELKILIGFIEDNPWIRQHIEYFDKVVQKRNQVTFKMLWLIFPPGTLVVVADSEEERSTGGSGYLVESIVADSSDGDIWVLNLLQGYHSGGSFSIRRTRRTIHHFYGRKKISFPDLKVVPLPLIPKAEREELRQRLIERGKRYVDYCAADMTALQYRGRVALQESENVARLGAWGSTGVLRIDIDERVIIDRTAQHSVSGLTDEKGDWAADSLTSYFEAIKAEGGNPKASAAMSRNGIVEKARLQDLARFGFTKEEPHGRKDRKESDGYDYGESANPPDPDDGGLEAELTDDDYFICQSTTVAFALDQKTWVSEVRIAYLSEIEWRGDPFSSLQFTEGAKRLVLRLVKGFIDRSSTDTYDDIIKGKGKGLMFLLHGPPGLGKTLTAESVAESARRPLYRVTTGELSTDVEKLESQLSDILRLGARWKAVVLLDEADVLMTRRSVSDLHRNAIVAVFLRLLEYYRGMLFLTTNRVDNFDEAFYSRIHITLEYGELKKEWRSNIWRQHVHLASSQNQTPATKLWSDEMFLVLGELGTNGREIKNYTRTAYAFARAENEDLALQHVIMLLENNFSHKKREQFRAVFDKLKKLSLGPTGG